MDITDTIKATSIGLGTGEGRKLLGLHWSAPTTKKVHRTLACPSIPDVTIMGQFPVYEVEGVARMQRGGQEPAVDVHECPEIEHGWRSQAKCTGMDNDIFFNPHQARIKAAQAVCAECPVSVECFEYGVATDSVGIWGGVYFNNRTTERKETIEQHRAKIRAES